MKQIKGNLYFVSLLLLGLFALLQESYAQKNLKQYFVKEQQLNDNGTLFSNEPNKTSTQQEPLINGISDNTQQKDHQNFETDKIQLENYWLVLWVIIMGSISAGFIKFFYCGKQNPELDDYYRNT
ncbi:UNKNOWN [Stylonychia lemnae]|uniref:Transmembrane protein n=1 Tax=Stylonychia lemnae TaxID=5949 RepID=A0A078AFP9_STYLE|nr:UNKNOWN [Stylonychia lemnae]|eukprot:CDW80661.1 UNKNOWN [Stylonychia lemnae]